MALSLGFREVGEGDHRWVADGGVLAGELELAGVAIDAEGGHVVGSLVAAVEKLAGGVKAEAAWVVAVRPGFVDVGEVAG